MQKKLLIGYVIVLHLFLGLILTKSDFCQRVGYRLGLIKHITPEISKHYKQTKRFLERVDDNTPDGVVVFVGDSGIQGLCVSAVVQPSVNFGIGTDTTVGVLMRLPTYRSLDRASLCVLSIGGNDLRRRDNGEILKNYTEILEVVPSHLPIVVNAVMPADERVRSDLIGRNLRTIELNSSLKALCHSNGSSCTFVDPGPKFIDSSGNLKTQYHEGDGIHLNGVGNAIWIKELKGVVEKTMR